MPLPSEPKQPWPPMVWADVQREVDEAAAWYSGDPDKLSTFYSGPVTGQPQSSRRGWSRFWGRRSQDPRSTPRQQIHVPAAADIAATAADLLFGDAPRLIVPEAHSDDAPQPSAEGEPADPVTSAASAAEERLQEWMEEGPLAATLLEAAEVASALSGVYLRPIWDESRELVARPTLTVMHPDCAVPEFAFGQLAAVTFWRQLEAQGDGKDVWRHLERWEPGYVLHGLYRGDAKTLGVKMPLANHPATAKLGETHEDGIVQNPEGMDGLLCRYVPNVRPNRKHRGLPIGRSDYQGCEPMMDALDEAMTSWMRDIRLGQARIIVPQSYLERRGRGQGATFDLDAEVFTGLEMEPSGSQDARSIETVEFKLRTDEHATTTEALFTQIVSSSGYSPQSFGLKGEGAQMTATEVDAKEGKSDRTTGRKQRYWAPALSDMAYIMLGLDKAVYGSPIEPVRPRVAFRQDADLRSLASTLNLINLGRAASIETRVRMLNPEWDEPQIQQEAERIRKEEGVGDPTGGLPL